MVAPPTTGGSPSTSNPPQILPLTSSFRVSLTNTTNQGPFPYAPHIPFSARRASPLDMSTVERKGHPLATRESNKRIRPHGLQDAPTFRPTEDEFRDPMEYMRKIAPEGRKYGICKIIPPEGWKPDFAIDTEKFHFRTRRQELNSVEGGKLALQPRFLGLNVLALKISGTRTNLNYLDQLAKFHKQHGTNLNRFPSVDKRPLDLYKLKKAVETRGGFDKVCKLKKWAEIGRILGYSGKIMSSLSTSLKNSYQKWLHPYEEYLRIAKPGVQQQLEFEYGGPFTPSSADSPMRRAHQDTPPLRLRDDSPAIRASATLNATLKESEEPSDPPPPASGFTAVNSGGFTPVNLNPASSFQAVNHPNFFLKREVENGTPPSVNRPSNDGLMPIGRDTSEFRNTNLSMPHTNGHDQNPLKRTISHDSMNVASGTDSMGVEYEDQNGRRSKRIRKAAPTVVGSHMSLLRPMTPRVLGERANRKSGELCEACGKNEDRASILICDGCENGYHRYCLDPPVKIPPDCDWHCPRCLVGTGEFGFEEGGIYSLREFQEKAHNFKESYFAPKMPFDPVKNCKRLVTEDDVEREFWRLVESITEMVEVEYGADIHSTTHGSGFPTIEKNPLDPYSRDPWNLNILPLHPESLFQHIKTDISGMTVPWLYVGMCFSTFCWHNEDHYSYSCNYQHFGATKTWYGIPGADAERFELAMKQAVPELFATQPDLLFQLVTLLPPDQLKKADVNVYALDQRAGQFVITFPQAYHAGFNHGFNFNEAVNFAPHDWEPFGEAGAERLQAFRKQPCFSHDELLITASGQDTSIKSAKWLAPALVRLRDRELKERADFLRRHNGHNKHDCAIDGSDPQKSPQCELGFETDEQPDSETEYQCNYCKAYSYLSHFQCHSSSKIMCLLHAGTVDCCEGSEERRLTTGHVLRYRFSDEVLKTLVQKVVDRAGMPEAWQEKLDKVLDEEPRPSLKVLRSMVSEGEKIPYPLPGLSDLKAFVIRCNEWVDDAANYLTRKQQNRRKNERSWRKGNAAKAAGLEERDREYRKIENIHKLLAAAKELSFECPEISNLSEKSGDIAQFRSDASKALVNLTVHSIEEFEGLVEKGKAFNVDIPEIEELEKVVRQMKWNEQACEGRNLVQTLDDVATLIATAADISIPEENEHLVYYKLQEEQGRLWESKAKELISVESVHYQQLEALSNRATSLPVSRETLAAVDAILTKQREAHRTIVSMYERCKDPDLRRRPKYKEVRDALDSLSELNSKPSGTFDLEKEIKRHEDWMRRGKKLFGKANAPLHILQVHMNHVTEHNVFCFDLQDKPRMPVEPSSREHTPVDSQEIEDVRSSRDVFCMCRQSEAGMMIECELCHEWYHGKCLKIARGKVKDDDKYTCPICDWRVKIPRDASRPKLEDLQDWQSDIVNLPFQPEEEDVLEEIISTAQNFRDFMRPYVNPVMTTPEEVTTQRFYLRKIEGAEVLLADETNFFRQELHKWAPVAPDPPPVLEISLSTRKPRPTKQQKLMTQLGIEDPEALPIQFRTKPHNFTKTRKSSDTHSNKSHQPLQPAPRNRNRSDTPHSASTGNGTDPHTHGHRLPTSISSTHTDPTYTAFFPAAPLHNHHISPDSPRWNYLPGHHSSQHPASLMELPHFNPSSPSSRSGPPIDPSLCSPTNNQFATTMSSHTHSNLLSPRHHSYSDGHHSGNHMENNIFDDYVADQSDDIGGRNEAAEALEEEEQRRMFEADEYLNDELCDD